MAMRRKMVSTVGLICSNRLTGSKFRVPPPKSNTNIRSHSPFAKCLQVMYTHVLHKSALGLLSNFASKNGNFRVPRSQFIVLPNRAIMFKIGNFSVQMATFLGFNSSFLMPSGQMLSLIPNVPNPTVLTTSVNVIARAPKRLFPIYGSCCAPVVCGPLMCLEANGVPCPLRSVKKMRQLSVSFDLCSKNLYFQEN